MHQESLTEKGPARLKKKMSNEGKWGCRGRSILGRFPMHHVKGEKSVKTATLKKSQGRPEVRDDRTYKSSKCALLDLEIEIGKK